MSDIKFFGKIDRNKDNYISSDLPAWMMKAQIKDLTESIEAKERALSRGIYELDQVPTIKAEMALEKKKLETIMASKPKLKAGDKDRLAAMRKEVEAKIVESNFSYSDMMTGEADPHEEAERMVKPCIDIPAELADMCDIPTHEGKVSRNEAVRAWRIAGGYLSEDINPEHLRKDKRRG